MNRVMLPCPLERELAEAMGRTLRAQDGRLDWRRFPDGEPPVAIDDALFLEESFHWLAWKKPFGGFLAQRAAEADEPLLPLEIKTGYPRYTEA